MNRLIISVTLSFMAVTAVSAQDVIPEAGVAADSVVVITPDSLLNRAAEAFKHTRFLKFEGEKQDTVAPAAYATYQMALEALDAQEPNSLQWMRAKEILRETSGDLLSGAFHYSGAGNQPELTRYAQAVLDIRLLDAFKGDSWTTDNNTVAMLSYIAASGAYNSGDYKRAIKYFQSYLTTGAEERREQVYLFMSQACLKAQEYDLGIAACDQALTLYPAQKQLMLIGMQMCIDGGRGERLQQFLTRALTLNPTDEQLLNVQGKLYEDEGEYEKALALYMQLDETHPNSLSTAKHISLCYYNLAADYYNKAINEKDEKIAARNRRQAKSYFSASADKLRQILDSDPNAVTYLRSLGVCYLCLEDKFNFEKINERLILLGQDPLAEVFMPPTMTYNGNGDPNFGRSQGAPLTEAPSYSDFAREEIVGKLEEWARKGEFEKTDAYMERVNENTIRAKYDELNKIAADKYLATYANRLRLNELKLEPYDATNEVFLVRSSYGPIYLNVPLKNDEAEQFKQNWKNVRFRNPQYFIDQDSVRIASITFIVGKDREYTYDNARSHNYVQPDINISFDEIIYAGRNNKQNDRNLAQNQIKIGVKSDVDVNIPETGRNASKTLALVVANEKYKHVANVPYADADGSTFVEYCRKTLGIPEHNISFQVNASYAELLDAVSEIQRKAEVLGPESELIVYYAGHGLPDENTKDAFLLSSDANPVNSRTWYKLSELYATLSELPSRSVSVFIDACFSGAERSGKMLTADKGMRAVAIKPKEAAPKGNMFVLTATSGNETAMPYSEKNHGMFTYFLLKKLQESKGNVTLKDLSDYVISNVRHQSNFVNEKPQTPAVSTSGTMVREWSSKKLAQ